MKWYRPHLLRYNPPSPELRIQRWTDVASPNVKRQHEYWALKFIGSRAWYLRVIRAAPNGSAGTSSHVASQILEMIHIAKMAMPCDRNICRNERQISSDGL